MMFESQENDWYPKKEKRKDEKTKDGKRIDERRKKKRRIWLRKTTIP
jgi:hypothetical protein